MLVSFRFPIYLYPFSYSCQILVRNNFTGQIFYFNCGRWFGRGVEDGALERLLVAENFSSKTATDSESDMDTALSQRGMRFETGSGFTSRSESPASFLFSPRKTRNLTAHTDKIRHRSPSSGRISIGTEGNQQLFNK